MKGISTSVQRRLFSSSRQLQLSPLFALGALSNARETQHLAKDSRLSRVEHSPNLQLIRSSEVDPYAPPVVRPPSMQQRPQPKSIEVKPKISAGEGLRDADLMSVGRAILKEKNEELAKLRRLLEEEKDRSVKREATYALARTKSRDRLARLHGELSSEKLWKWTFLVLGLAGCSWLYASKEGKVAFSLGDASPVAKIKENVAKPIPVRTQVDKSTMTEPVKAVTVPAVAPNPVVVVESASPASGSIFTRLFWRS